VQRNILLADKQLCNNLYRLRLFGISFKTKFGLLAQKTKTVFSFIVPILKRVLLLYSWYKVVSVGLEVYSSGCTKLQQLSEISSSLRFVTNIIVDNGKWTIDNAQEILTLMWLGMLLSSIVSGSYIFTVALVVAKYHEFSRNARLDACMVKRDE
jgi:hypothetical protein